MISDRRSLRTSSTRLKRIAGRRNQDRRRGKFPKTLDAVAEHDYKALKEFKLVFWFVDKVYERNVQ